MGRIIKVLGNILIEPDEFENSQGKEYQNVTLVCSTSIWPGGNPEERTLEKSLNMAYIGNNGETLRDVRNTLGEITPGTVKRINLKDFGLKLKPNAQKQANEAERYSMLTYVDSIIFVTPKKMEYDADFEYISKLFDNLFDEIKYDEAVVMGLVGTGNCGFAKRDIMEGIQIKYCMYLGNPYCQTDLYVFIYDPSKTKSAMIKGYIEDLDKLPFDSQVAAAHIEDQLYFMRYESERENYSSTKLYSQVYNGERVIYSDEVQAMITVANELMIKENYEYSQKLEQGVNQSYIEAKRDEIKHHINAFDGYTLRSSVDSMLDEYNRDIYEEEGLDYSLAEINPRQLGRRIGYDPSNLHNMIRRTRNFKRNVLILSAVYLNADLGLINELVDKGIKEGRRWKPFFEDKTDRYVLAYFKGIEDSGDILQSKKGFNWLKEKLQEKRNEAER